MVDEYSSHISNQSLKESNNPFDESISSHYSNKTQCKITILFSYNNEMLTVHTWITIINSINNINKYDLNETLEWLTDNSLSSINLNNYTISLYDSELYSYIHLGQMPLNRKVLLEYDKNIQIINITLRLREIIKKEGMLRMELLEEENDIIDEDKANIFISAKSKRAKERKIGDIIRKVYMWRRLYSGYIDERHREIKLSLEEAADRIKISKKSLDDYLIQLRLGKIAGFNFNEHKNDKVGILRAFVKKQKSLKDFGLINYNTMTNIKN